VTKSGKPTKASSERKPIKSHNKLNWLAGLDDKTRISFLERLLMGNITFAQVKMLAKKFKVNTLYFLLFFIHIISGNGMGQRVIFT